MHTAPTRFTKLSALAMMGLSLCACSSVKEAINGPQLAPMGVPSAVVMQNQPVMSAPDSRPASSNTLWRSGARDFFNDQRAKRVGDILTVMIDIDDQAQTQNNTTHSRTNDYKATLPSVLGFESSLGKVLPNGYDPANPLSANGSNSFAGNGAIKRSEKISLTMAAMVTGVLPNGNLIIQGRQEVKANFDVRELTVAGIVRPEDISSANTVKHTQLAEARISYGGRGDISRNQKAPAIQSVMEAVSPF